MAKKREIPKSLTFDSREAEDEEDTAIYFPYFEVTKITLWPVNLCLVQDSSGTDIQAYFYK